MKKTFAIYITLAVIIAAMASCGGTLSTASQTGTTAGNTTAQSGTTSTSPAAPGTEPTTLVSSTVTLEDVLARAAAVASLYCEAEVTAPVGSESIKEWVQGGRMRMELTSGADTITIINDGHDFYMYEAGDNIAYMLPPSSSAAYMSALDEAEALKDYSTTQLSSETVDGKDCYVFQYTEQGATTTEWLWQDYGLPVKITVSDASGTTTTLFTNFSFDTIEASQFTLPMGVMITTVPGM